MVDEEDKTLTVEEYAVDGEVHTQGQVTTDFVSPEIEQAWMQEAMRRSEALQAGKIGAGDALEVLDRIKTEILG